MDKEKELKRINKELKVYINEASFVSNNCRNKLIKMLGKEFGVSLPVEDFLNIDVALDEYGNITMRGDTYSQDEKLSFEEVLERYKRFSESADGLLKRHKNKAFPSNDKNNLINLFVVLLLSGLFITLAVFGIKSFLQGNFYNLFWLLVIVFSFIVPSVRDRFSQAYYYLKRIFKK